jgi:hypothetical protein
MNKNRRMKQLPMNTQAIVTEEAILKADPIERCRLMREIVRGAKYSATCAK